MKRLLLISLGLGMLSACQTENRLPESVPPYAVPDTTSADSHDQDNANTDSTEEDDAQENVDLWDDVRDGFKLEVPADSNAKAAVDRQIRFFSENKKSLEASLNRAAPYLYLVMKEIEKRDLPTELALLPIIESSYNPKAKSPNGAGGLWQFIPGTAKVLGLKKNSFYDGKHDVFASTQAALDYLNSLNKNFDGDWYATLAAYNAGAGTVQRAMIANQNKGKKTDFWDLRLAQHTREYVPKLLALAEMLKDPEHYGLDWRPVANQPVMRKVDLDKPIALSEAAEMANCPLEELVSLNPGFVKPWSVTGGPGYLMLPADKADDFSERLSHMPAAQMPDYVTYTVKDGDSLRRIAKQYHVAPERLRQINHLFGTRDPKVGRVLKIPLSNKPFFDPLDSDGELADQRRSYKVRSGDTLWKLSRQFKISQQALAEANNLGSKPSLKPGQLLNIPGDAEIPPNPIAVTSADKTKPTSGQAITYTVKRGDSLNRIASKYKVAVADLMRWNKALNPKTLKPGQSLRLFVDAAPIDTDTGKS